ncbi:MAG: anthranilate phosphoribosyltransferase [Candidatus Dadabacteria bacterium]|nr:anthranilate phosphoribosyltransferase [Candidatus Dadabacteria bacterium]
MIKEAIAKVVERIDLEEKEMAKVMENMMDGTASTSQMAAFLMGLRMKGETVSEITGAAKVMRDKAIKIRSNRSIVIDLCGTGGDQQGTFNVSTAASLIAAGAGAPVAKHGNRSVSSQVGSADVLENLGININLSKKGAEKCLDEIGIVFLFAPIYHPAMKNVSQLRKDVGVRTIFNVLGPLTNPADVKHQIMGVYSEVLVEPMAKVLRNLGYLRAMVVHGADMLDEITVTGKTQIAELKDGMIKMYQFDPLELGFKRRKLEELKGGNAGENAKIFLSILRGEEREAKREIAVLNAAAGILVSGVAGDMKEAIAMAEDSIDGSKALNKLNELIRFTRNWSDG